MIGKGEAFWSGDEGDRMTVVAGKPSYHPGDTARLLVKTPIAGEALVTIERGERIHNVAEVHIAKQRHGPIGVVELYFDGMVTKFSNLVRDDSLGGH